MIRDYVTRMDGAVWTRNKTYRICPFCNVHVKKWELYTHPCREDIEPIREYLKSNSRKYPEYEFIRSEEKSMANVQICERDGKVITAAVAGSVYYRANPNSDGKDYTLCPECSRELYRFLHPQNSTAPIMVAFDPSQEPPQTYSAAETTRAAITQHVDAQYGESA